MPENYGEIATEWASLCVRGKESPCNAGVLGLIPGPERSPGEGNGNLPRILAWGILDRKGWQATVYGVTRLGYDLETKPPLPATKCLRKGSVNQGLYTQSSQYSGS